MAHARRHVERDIALDRDDERAALREQGRLTLASIDRILQRARQRRALQEAADERRLKERLLAAALEVDPAEFFTTEVPSGVIRRGVFLDITTRLAGLSGADLAWLSGIVEAALTPRGGEPGEKGSDRPASSGKKASQGDDLTFEPSPSRMISGALKSLRPASPRTSPLDGRTQTSRAGNCMRLNVGDLARRTSANAPRMPFDLS